MVGDMNTNTAVDIVKESSMSVGSILLPEVHVQMIRSPRLHIRDLVGGAHIRAGCRLARSTYKLSVLMLAIRCLHQLEETHL